MLSKKISKKWLVIVFAIGYLMVVSSGGEGATSFGAGMMFVGILSLIFLP